MYLLFFSNLIITKGITRSVILDLQNEQFEIIPNSLADFVLQFNKTEKQIIYQSFPEDVKSIVDDYLEWLEKKGFITWIQDIDALQYFSELKIQWDGPNQLTNIIVDIGTPELLWDKIIQQVGAYRIPFLQMRFFRSTSIEEIHDLLIQTEQTPLKGIEIMLQYYDDLNLEQLKLLLTKFLRVYQVIIYASPENQEVTDLFEHIKPNIFFLKSKITSAQHCGVVDSFQFRSNMSLYMEGNFFNTCLNRKISVDEYGNIKNCPSMPDSYGNISNTELDAVLHNDKFKRLWNINKDQISICKTCEFRMICTDCRAYTRNPEDIYSKPLKCGYDPYTGNWENWSTNPLNKKAINYYQF
jgi:SPASM domain peptide maturase of grasp-with-spasm system